MKKRTIILIIIGYIISIIATATITVIIMKNNDKELNRVKVEEKQEKNENQKETLEEEKPTIKEEKDESKENAVTKEDNNEIVKDNSSNNIANENTTTEITTPSNTQTPANKSEADIISYIENISLEEGTAKLKSGFVTVVDFLFYNGEIYGKRFSELSNSTKIKVVELALKIDSKIDEYFPEYKEKISSATSKAYTSIKTKLVTLYLDTTVKICNDNPTLCEDAKRGLTELKQNFGLTWDFIKDISGVGLTKLKDWYEVWREE